MISNTQENIINALFQLANKHPLRSDFSIAEIADKAGISRQAIYKKYFKNETEILNYLHQEIDKNVMTVLLDYKKQTDPFTYFAENVLPIIYKYRNWLKYLYSTALDPNWTSFLKKQYLSWAYKNISFRNIDNLSKDILTEVLVGDILNIIEIWMTQEIPDHPQKFTKTFLLLIHKSLDDLVSNKNK